MLHIWTSLTGAAISALVGLCLSVPAAAQAPEWAPADLLAAAKAEGGAMTVYGSMNEQEALPYYKLFEDATGIKVTYVRASDTALFSRILIEHRARQRTWDLVVTTPVNRLPDEVLLQFEPNEAKNVIPQARGPNKRWYGVYANYNSPAYNTQKVKASDLPATYEEFAKRKEWAGQVAIDGTDNEWLKAMFEHYGEQKATQVIKDIVTTLKPIVTDGHLAMARATGAGEYAISLNNYVNLSINVKLAGSPIEIFALDPVAMFFGQVAINAKAPSPNAAKLAANFMLSQECQQFLAKFGRLPTRSDVKDNPPGTVELLRKKKVITTLLTPEEERGWQRRFAELFKPR